MQSTEEWRSIPPYDGVYEASDLGRIRRVGAAKAAVVGRVLRHHVTPDGRASVRLSFRNVQKTWTVHRLVALAFHGHPAPGQEVCHFDGDPLNNRADNLRWDTHSANKLDDRRNGVGNAAKTHCPRGHAYDNENTYVPRNRRVRVCRICQKVNVARWKAAHTTT